MTYDDWYLMKRMLRTIDSKALEEVWVGRHKHVSVYAWNWKGVRIAREVPPKYVGDWKVEAADD